MTTEINEDILEGEDMVNLEELDEKEVLGDDDEEKISTIITKKEFDGDDLYDAAIEPSGQINEKRESAEVQSSLPSSIIQQKMVKTEPSNVAGGQQQYSTTKRYCCYIGNMTWWTTDLELEKTIKSLDIDDLIDTRFFENRNNGQSKGFALAVFKSEASVKMLMEKLPTKKVHDQTPIMLPYTKQSLAKLEEATKRFDQKPGKADANVKEEKVVNIGTVRIGANGAPVPQLMSSLNLAQLTRPVVQQSAVIGQQPTSLLSLNFPAPPNTNAALRSAQSSVGLTASAVTVPPGTQQQQDLLGPSVAAVAAAQQQQQLAAASLAAQQQQQQNAAALIMQQHVGGSVGVGGVSGGASIGGQQRQNTTTIPSLNLNQPPPNAHVAALQQAMSRPPPTMQSLGGLNTAVSQSLGISSGLVSTGHLQSQQQYRQNLGGGMQQSIHQQTMPPPGFPPGAHINPQVYPGYAQNSVGVYGGLPENGATMISEAEFQEIMNRNQTVSSSAIHRAVSDAASGDYPSAIETLVTAISLIRQSRVAHDDRCKLLVNTLQDTLNGIEAKHYSSSGGSRKHRRERSRSPIRTSKRHRRSPSRSRSRDRGYSDYSPPIRHSMTRRY